MSGWFFGGGFTPDPPPQPEEDRPEESDRSFTAWVRQTVRRFEDWIDEQRLEFANYINRAAQEFEDILAGLDWYPDDDDDGEEADDVVTSPEQLPPGYNIRQTRYPSLLEARAVVDSTGMGSDGKIFFLRSFGGWQICVPTRKRQSRSRPQRTRSRRSGRR
ncbi:MAG: hypothetical protein ACOCX3_03790 [Chloroflexota bacterium]